MKSTQELFIHSSLGGGFLGSVSSAGRGFQSLRLHPGWITTAFSSNRSHAGTPASAWSPAATPGDNFFMLEETDFAYPNRKWNSAKELVLLPKLPKGLEGET